MFGRYRSCNYLPSVQERASENIAYDDQLFSLIKLEIITVIMPLSLHAALITRS